MSISGVASNITDSSNTIELYQGESRDLNLEVVQDSKDLYGNPIEIPVDLTGATVTFSVRKKVDDPTLLIGKDTTNALALEILDPATCGKAVIHLLSIDTQYLEPGTYVFDVWVTLASTARGIVIKPAEFIVKAAPTKIGQ